MRGLYFLSTLLFLADAKSAEKRAECALDGAKAVSDMSDAAVYLWAAVKRCENKAPAGNPMSPKCEVDIAAAIQAVNNMVVVMVEAAHDCGDIHTENYKCGIAVGELTGAASGLASGAGSIVHDCPGKHPTSKDPGLDRLTNNGNCFLDGKTVVGSLFEATVKLSKANRKCKEGQHSCARNALNIISAFSSMGSAIAGAVNDCGQVAGKANNAEAACSQSVLQTASVLHQVADAGLNIAEECKVDEARLYELEHEDDEAPQQGSLAIMLAAFLPVSAVLSFVAGSRFSKSRQVTSTARDCDTEMLMPTDASI